MLRNENKTEDMIEILEELHQYVPVHDGENGSVFIGGDQLTCEQIRGANQQPTRKDLKDLLRKWRTGMRFRPITR